VKEDDKVVFVCGLLSGLFLGGMLAVILTRVVVGNSYEQAAVANNCGHYVVNQSGDVVFTWKKEKTDE
jgi:hypothetical protein